MYWLKKKHIKFGLSDQWADVEADEVDIAKGEDPLATQNSAHPIVWEQGGWNYPAR